MIYYCDQISYLADISQIKINGASVARKYCLSTDK